MKTIAKYILSGVFALSMASTASAWTQSPVLQQFVTTNKTADGVRVSDVVMHRNNDDMVVTMNVDMSDTKMEGDRAIIFAPVLVNGSDSLVLNPIGLYGRTRWIQYRRAGEKPLLGGKEYSFQYSHRPSSFEYKESVPFEEWMNGSTLVLKRCDFGCCRKLLAQDQADLAHWGEYAYKPTFKFVRPEAADPKIYEIEGQAFIDFPVDQTVIYPEYRNNTFWLDSIRRTIDVVRNDPDATIQTVWLKGFASPESPYSHNTDLAKGRTAALKTYIQLLYNFDGADILTDYEPEDWEGLRKAVVASNLPNRKAILDLIDSKMEPDAKEAKIKKLYPADYKYMLDNFYPPLRHTNYKVKYMVRPYTSPEEILEVMRTRPGNLSINEFFLAASVLEPGSDDFNDVFDTAVRLYPDNQVVNLNAGLAAMQRGDFGSAGRYLSRAGDTADVDYARAVYNTLTGNYKEAADYLDKAVERGYQGSEDDLKQLREVIKFGQKVSKK